MDNMIRRVKWSEGKRKILRKTRRYGPLRGPTSSSCGGLWPSAEAFYYAVLAHFWCPVVTLVTFSSNISNNTKKQQKNPKKFKKFKKI